MTGAAEPTPPPAAQPSPALGAPAWVALLVALWLLPFLVGRVQLLVWHRDAFVALTSGQLCEGLIAGLRFDLSTVAMLAGVPLALALLPVAPRHRLRWPRAWAWMAFAPLPLACLLLGSDALFFGEVRRHLGREVILARNETGFVAGMVGAHLGLVSFWVGVAAVLAVAWRKVAAMGPRPARRPWLTVVVVAALLFLCARGSLDRKVLNPVDAYRGRSNAQGNLVLNGVYTVLRATLDGAEATLEPAISLEAAYAELGLDPSAPHPVERRVGAGAPTRRSVVLLLLESWDVRWSGAYGGRKGSVTPCFDALAAEGLLFERMYASTQRTIGGVQASLTGIPCVPGVPELGRGLEQVNVTRVAALARAIGYRTFFLQAPRRRSYYLDSVMEALGFETSYGLEDIPVRATYPDPDPRWGWDHDALQFALERIDALEGAPFFVVLLTGTSHSPYADPGEAYHRRPHEEHGEGGYVNTLAYSDRAVGEFMRGARARPWGADTVFVLSADHVFRSLGEDLRENFNIPFLITGSGVAPGRSRDVRSQLEVLPTLVDLLGLPEPVSTLGRSLLEPGSTKAVVRLGDVIGAIGEEGWMTHTLAGRLESWPADLAPSKADGLERRLLATQRVAAHLVGTNRWARPSE